MKLANFIPRISWGAAPAAAPAGGPRASVQELGGGVDIDLNDPESIRRGMLGGETTSGIHVGESTALKVAAVWRCLHLIGGVVANMPIELMERVNDRERRPATDNPVRALLATRPNHWQTPSEFKRMLTVCTALRGAGYAYKVPGALGAPQALWPIHPDRIRCSQGPDMSLNYLYTRPNGQQVPLRQDEVLHLRGLTLDGVNGLGVLAFGRESFGLAIQGQRAAGKMWKQGAMVGGALKHPGQLSDESYARLQDSLAARNSGAENTGKWMILEENMDVADIFLSATDMQFLESRAFERSDIAMFFGVPPHMIGDVSKTTSWGSGVEAQKDGFVAFTAEDYLTTWEEAARRDLLTPAEAKRLYWRFNRAALVRGDIKTRWQAYQLALQWGVLSPDEVRELEDRNPRGDGRGGDYYDPPNTAGGDAAPKEDPADAEPKEPTDD